MFLRTADVLTAQTQAYWRLSSIVQGTLTEKITTCKAIEQINALEFSLGPSRPLLRNVKQLGNTIIEGCRKKKVTSSGAVLQLVRTGV